MLRSCFPSSVFCILLSACGVTPGGWQILPTVSRPVDSVLQDAREVVTREGFSIDSEAPSEGGVRLMTGWKTQLSPHWRQGKRRRVEVFVQEAETGGTVTKVRTYLEINETHKNSTSPELASWSSEGGDEELAIRVIEMLRMRLLRPKMDE